MTRRAHRVSPAITAYCRTCHHIERITAIDHLAEVGWVKPVTRTDRQRYFYAFRDLHPRRDVPFAYQITGRLQCTHWCVIVVSPGNLRRITDAIQPTPDPARQPSWMTPQVLVDKRPHGW